MFAKAIWPARACVVVSAFVGGISGCPDAQRGTPPLDAGPDTSTNDAQTPDAEAGPPPLDFECANEPWTMSPKRTKACEGRIVSVVNDARTTDVRTLSVARTPMGRVGIAYNTERNPEIGEFHLAHFIPKQPAYAPAVIIKRSSRYLMHEGYANKLAASAPDTLTALTYDRVDPSNTGELHLRRLVGGVEPLTDTFVAAAVANPTELALASDAEGKAYATYRFSTGSGNQARVQATSITAAGAVTALPLLTNVSPDGASGIGATSLTVDATGQLHALIHYSDAAMGEEHSTPRYYTLGGDLWSQRKTIDNAQPDGLAGFSPRIAVYGTHKYAVFFFRRFGQVFPATAELRLASWESTDERPVIEIIESRIWSADVLAPLYSAALAVDPAGLLHIAAILPSSTTRGTLAYYRQIVAANGGKKWLIDIVDGNVIDESGPAYVDMVVDEHARPHIAYLSGKDHKVKYATRFDR
jgi:hypothetical protein